MLAEGGPAIRLRDPEAISTKSIILESRQKGRFERTVPWEGMMEEANKRMNRRKHCLIISD